MSARSNRRDVRNPMLADPAVVAEWQRLQRDHPEAAAALVRMLRTLSERWREKAKECWNNHKAPMAAYHKANAVNARHSALVGSKPVPTCGRIFNGIACSMPSSSSCPDCGPAAHDFQDDS